MKQTSDRWCDRALIVSPIYYALCMDEKAFNAELRRLKVPKDQRPQFVSAGANATTHHLDAVAGKPCAIVCIRTEDDHSPIQIAALLVHEAVHVWQAIRDNLGERQPSSEFEAYSIQCIAQELMERYAMEAHA